MSEKPIYLGRNSLVKELGMCWSKKKETLAFLVTEKKVVHENKDFRKFEL